MKTGSQSGLTVVEALVIVAIVAILIALCPCSLAPARERARRANCLSNLRQLGIGISNYYEDHTNMPPMASMHDLAVHVGPYVGHSPRLFHCPSDPHFATATATSNLTKTSYVALSGVVWQANLLAPLLADKFDLNCPITVLTGNNTWSPRSAHKDGGNVLWTDGHVDWNKALDVGTNRYPLVND